MIRITHVITGLGQGGAETMLKRLLLGLDKNAFDQSVVSLTDRGIYAEVIEAAGIPLRTIGLGGVGTVPAGLYGLSRAIREFRPHIVQTWLFHADLLGYLAARWVGGPSVVWNIRCSSLDRGDVPLSTRWLIRLLAGLSSRPEAILFNSAAGLDAHRGLGYQPRRSEVIPNGFDLVEWRPDARRRATFRAEIDVADQVCVVGMVARYHRMKDHRTFLAAAARVRDRMPDVKFVLAGPGIGWTNDALVADISRFALQDCVILLGPRSDMPSVMAGLDCLMLTSTSEGFPNVLGEAMASGVPCVATDAGDAGFVVGDTGRIVPVGDAEGLADGVLMLMSASERERAALAERCRARIAEKYSMAQVVARYGSFYRELYEQRRQ